MSLRELTAWCDERFAPFAPASDLQPRPYDIPWVIMDNSEAVRDFGWSVGTALEQTLAESRPR